MARIDNLTNYLTDVSQAIKDKKGDQTAIPAKDFDTEIANLPSGGEDLPTLEYMQIMDLIDSKELVYSQEEIDKTDAYIEYYRKDVRLDGQTL